MSHRSQPADPIHIAEVTVAASGTNSSVLETNGYVPVAIRTPGTLTSTSLTFSAGLASDGSDLVPMRDSTGTAIGATVAASRHIPLNPSDFAGVHCLRLVMGSAETAGRTIQVILRRLGP